MSALKFDQEKPDMSLISAEFMIELAKVLTFGKNKYGAYNWRKGLGWSRPLGAALRHLYSWNKGEDKDPESGLSHLAHAACNLMFLITYEQTGSGTDDRYKGENNEATKG